MRTLTRTVRQVALAAGLSAGMALSAAAAPGYVECRTTEAIEFPGTIVDAAVATPALSTLVELVLAADLAGPLSAPGDLTVFAPTNAAFAKIPSPVLNAIGSDIDVLTAVLTYHVVPGAADPRTLRTNEVATLQGQTLFAGFDRGTGAAVNQSVADCTAVRTTNGTVWVIDSVLLPQFR